MKLVLCVLTCRARY
ncbi:hypothetical protein NFI96_020357 [Prochilodus magdalenae]|nr:hypothetical protein NFI96_020357 [Prochilodus magdalenae]